MKKKSIVMILLNFDETNADFRCVEEEFSVRETLFN
jgi:hypothetical protein